MDARPRGRRTARFVVAGIAAVVSGQLMIGGAGAAEPVPGTAPLSPSLTPTPAGGGTDGLELLVNERGFVSQSIAGTVSVTEAGSQVIVTKPAGATTRAAFMAVATTGFSITPLGDPVTLDGQAVALDNETSTGISSYNYFTDVTGLVKPKLDAAPAGPVSFDVVEGDPALTEGEVLVVVYDDPAVTVEQSVSILFGALSPTGDTYGIDVSEPIDLDDPATRLEMSLGISYSHQQGGDQQYSTVDVNGERVTTAAGGEDDGLSENGALLTVGGDGDSTGNPADPFAPPTEPRSDDEYYDLRPFVADGDTFINVDTLNPSVDDNVFLATFTMNPPVESISTGEGLSVSLSADRDAVLAGEHLSWSAVARNAGPGDAPNASLVFEVSTDVTLHEVEAPPGWDCTVIEVVVLCLNPMFADGEVAEFVVHSSLPSHAPAGTVTGTATVESDAEDPDLEDNVDTVDVTVSRAADLTVMLDGPATGLVEEPVALDVHVTNKGPSTATGVVALLSTGAQVQVGDLDPGETVAMVVETVFLTAGTHTVSVEVSGTEADIDPSNNVDSLEIAIVAPTAEPTLPPTGPEETAGVSGAGLAVILAGIGMILWARRRLVQI